jgi:hypothetical protein
MLYVAMAVCLALWALFAAVAFTYGVRAVVSGARLPAPDPAQPGGALAQALGAACRELVLTALTALAWPVGLVPARLFGVRGTAAPILLVPGACMTWTSCLPLRAFLRRQLPNSIAHVSCRPLAAPPERVATFLADRIRVLSSLADGAPVHVIGLGEGGLAALLAIGRDPTLPVGRVVTVATPRRAAAMGVFLPGGMARYHGLDGAPLARPTLAVGSAGDNLVSDDESRPPEGTATLELVVDGHLSCWYSPRVWRAALAALLDEDDG